jgi:hypothetical protein
MSIDPLHQSDENIAAEILKPMEELIAKENEELKKADELIREAERKSQPILHPGP